MKKVLFISPTGTLDNGAEISIVNLMEYLVQMKYEVYNIAPQHHHSKQIEYYDYCKAKGVQTFFIPVLKWWWPDAPGGMLGTRSSRAEAYRENVNEIRTIIQKYDIDVVITNTVNIFVGAIASSCESKKHIWLIHEFPENEFSYYRDKVLFIEQMSDQIFSVVGSLNVTLNKLFEKKVGTFVPFSKIEPTDIKKGDKTRIVCVGMVSERKNQMELIRAYEKLKKPLIELVFIGPEDPSYYKMCKKYIKEHKLDNISFLGYQQNPWSLVTDKDICVFPSKNETFGLVYVESILNGVPTIISDNIGHLTANNLIKQGSIYKLGSIDQLTKSILDCLDNFERIKRELIDASDMLQNRFSVNTSYTDLICEIDKPKKTGYGELYFISDLVSKNSDKSRIALTEIKVGNFFAKIKKRLRNRGEEK